MKLNAGFIFFMIYSIAEHRCGVEEMLVRVVHCGQNAPQMNVLDNLCFASVLKYETDEEKNVCSETLRL